MWFTIYAYGILCWLAIGCISCFSYLIIILCSMVVMLTVSRSTGLKPASEYMSNIVSTYGFSEEIVDVSGVKIHCVIRNNDDIILRGNDSTNDQESGSSEPERNVARASDDVIVFIHGTASSSIIFFDVMKHMPPTIKCVAIDLPNFGISGTIDLDTHPNNQSIIKYYADIIGNTLIQLGIMENTTLVSHSLGGFFSIYVADRYPIKKLIMLNPAGILPTLGVYGYYWAIFFKSGMPTTLFHIPLISHYLLISICRYLYNYSRDITDFWLSFFMNNENNGHVILQRLITLRPFYSYWNTPAINTLLDVYKKVPTYICFGEDDTIIPSHIGEFLDELTGGEIMIHNIRNASHNPCCNLECFMKYIDQIITNTNTNTESIKKKGRVRFKLENSNWRCCGYSYFSLRQTKESFQNIYKYIITNHES